MGRSYGNKEVELKPATLAEPLLTAIGRLVRACAEIEDMVDLFIMNLAEVNESRMTILLGRTAITRRIEMAEALAMLREDDALAVHKKAFDSGYYDTIDCRNAVAHGTLMGADVDGRLYFLTSTTAKPENGRARRQVLSYLPEQIIDFGKYAEDKIGILAPLLQVQELRKARLERPLAPHPKGQPQRSATPKQQPPSSTE